MVVMLWNMKKVSPAPGLLSNAFGQLCALLFGFVCQLALLLLLFQALG